MRRPLEIMGLTALSWVLVACASDRVVEPAVAEPLPPAASNQAPAASAVAPTPVPDGEQRLSTQVRPLDYRLSFDVDPARDVFQGRTQIRIMIDAPQREVVLHGGNLRILRAVATQATPVVRELSPRVVVGTNAGLALAFDEPISGEWILQFDYSAPLGETPESLYRVNQGQRWYAFTQFEAIMARNAFPCFDEPGFKTPFEIAIRAPSGLTALSNAPLMSQHEEGAQTVFQFKPTWPIPTYLVALAVGPFERREAPIGALPHNIYTVAGRIKDAEYAAGQAPAILNALSDYFGSPYPFQKLDQLGVPNFRAGAMENVGLVTYRENILLVDSERASAEDKIVSRAIMAHELAHMWFGNLVTMQWWDDVWLNEAFATWMSNKVMDQIAPELESAAWAVGNMLDVMEEDALSSATPIKKQITGNGDIRNAFDHITYQKGLAVLRMLEGWVGPVAFQRGVRTYLTAHQRGNATMADFVAAIAAQTTQPVAAVASAFVEQPGTPMVSSTVRCSAAGVTVELAQQRYVPLGIDAEASRARTKPWTIPVCLKFLHAQPTQLAASEQCVLLDEPAKSFEFAAETCPSGVYPNANEAGYYQFNLEDNSLLQLSDPLWPQLSLAERVAFPRQALSLLQSGQLALPTFLRVIQNIAADRHRLVIDGVLKALLTLNRLWPADAPRTALGAYAKRLLQAHVTRIGIRPKANEPEANTLLRAPLLSTYGLLMTDPTLQRVAQAALQKFLANPDSIDLEQLQTLVPLAAAQAGPAQHQALVGLLAHASPTVRDGILRALGNFTDPALLERSYNLVLDGTVRATELWTLKRGTQNSDQRYAEYWRWYRANEPALKDRLGASAWSNLPWEASGHCSPAGRAAAAEQFADLSGYGSGAANNFRQAMENVDRCIALRARYSAELPALVR